MKIGILGTGVVGQALGSAFIALGHQVVMGSRSATNETALAWAGQAGPSAGVGTFAEAAAHGEVVVLATLGMANENVLGLAGADNLRGKVLIDTTNPLEFPDGKPVLAIAGNDSGGEQVQRLVPEARVVKAFNTVGSALMFRPSFPGGAPDMFICGDDAEAKAAVADILAGFGWGTVDIGGIESARYLEAMCMIWLMHAFGTDPPTWGHAFKLLRQDGLSREAAAGGDYSAGSYH